MIKKTCLAALAAAFILALAGCGAREFVIARERPAEAPRTEEVKEEPEPAEPEEPEEQADKEPEQEEPEEPAEVPFTADDARMVYSDFLSGNAKVTVSVNADHSGEIGMCYRDIIPDGSECTLNEILDALRQDVMTRFEVSDEEMSDRDFEMEAAEIDCGADGMPEYLISARLLVRMDEFTEFMIIKADGDTPRLCYSNSTGSRSFININEYGYIAEEGSGGASYDQVEKSFVDAAGQWHFLYGAASESDVVGQQIYYNDEMLSIPKKSAGDFKDVLFFRFWFEDVPEDARMYSYSYSLRGEYDENGEEEYSSNLLSRDEAIYAKDSVYMKTFEKLGIPVEPLTDIDEKIAQKEKAEGLDDMIKHGEIVMGYLGE